jgi:hypothetical protein
MNQKELELYSLPEMQEYFKKVMGWWRAGDLVYCTEEKRSFHYCDICYPRQLPKCCLRLPLAIDPINPERGLLGMIRGDSMYLACGVLGGLIREGIWTLTVKIGDRVTSNFGDTPAEALLLALREQLKGGK